MYVNEFYFVNNLSTKQVYCLKLADRVQNQNGAVLSKTTGSGHRKKGVLYTRMHYSRFIRLGIK